MGVKLAHNQYGKAETRVVRVYRDADPHELVDYNVSVALSGDFADIHLTGDKSILETLKAPIENFLIKGGHEMRRLEFLNVLDEEGLIDRG